MQEGQLELELPGIMPRERDIRERRFLQNRSRCQSLMESESKSMTKKGV